MIHRAWRLCQPSDDNLGLACTEQGLVLGRTPLIEQCGGRFFVRKQSEIEHLLKHAYRGEVPLERLMTGLATVASALNANEPALARIAAVHLRIPDLPDEVARDDLEAADILIKSGDWNPALHPRADAPPNPGWFAPTGGSPALSSLRTAQNETPNQSSDAALSAGDAWVRLRPAKRIEELGDFAEWLANATPEDEKAIRAEIKRYFEDVGWDSAARDLNSKLSVVLRPSITRAIRQRILDSIDLYTRVDPAEYVGTRDFLNAVALASTGLLATRGGPSPVWKLGWGKRGQIINDNFGDKTFPPNYPIIDKIPDGIATSIKSIDLNAATYHVEASLIYRLEQSVMKVREFEGKYFGGKKIDKDDILGRALQVVIPRSSMTNAQRIVIEKIRTRAKQGDKPVDIIITQY